MQLAEERKVDVNGTIRRAVEGTHLRPGKAAAALHVAAEEDELGFLISLAHPREFRVPDVLGIGEHGFDESDRAFLLRGRLHLGGRPGTAAAAAGLLDQRHRVAAEHPDDQDQDQHPESAAHRHPAAAAAGTPAILHVLALSSSFPAHDMSLVPP